MATKKPPAETVKQDKNRKRSGPGAAPQLNPYKFRAGQSGNPAGRPKRKTLTERIADLLDQTTLAGKANRNGCETAELLAEVILKEAVAGKFPFAKEVWDRIEGKVVERHEVQVVKEYDVTNSPEKL